MFSTPSGGIILYFLKASEENVDHFYHQTLLFSQISSLTILIKILVIHDNLKAIFN